MLFRSKPDEVLADAIGSFLLGNVDKARIKPVIDGLGLTDFDLGIAETKAQEKPAEQKPAEKLTTAEREKELKQINADIKRLSLEQIRSKDEKREAEIDEEMKPLTKRLRELQGKKEAPKKIASETGLSEREVSQLTAQLAGLEVDLENTIGMQREVIQDEIDSIKEILGIPLENVNPDFESTSPATNFVSDRQELIRRYQSARQKQVGIMKKFARGDAGLKIGRAHV